MKRTRLRLRMAKAILSTLPIGHALTYPNVRRYVNRDRLTCFSIRLTTQINESDWKAAIQLAREKRVSGVTDASRKRELLEKKNLADTLRKHYKTHPLVSTGTDD